jgi:hypothetical protein
MPLLTKIHPYLTDLTKLSTLNACNSRLVAHRKRRIKVSGSHREMIKVPEPRDADSRFVFPKMQVWKMVEDERGDTTEQEEKILWRLAIKLCREDGWDTSYGDFKDDPDLDERIKNKYKLLNNSYLRDKKLYFGK